MEKIARREFLTAIAMRSATVFFWGGLIGCATFKYVNQTATITSDVYSIEKGNVVKVLLDKVPELAKVGGSVTIIDSNLPDFLILARVSENDYVAASSKCTHRGKALAYYHDEKRFKCSALGKSGFELDGSKVSGPGKKPLKIYRSSLEKGLLIIHF